MRRLMRESSHSMQIATPSFIVTASGCAPPMPPSPAVSVMVPAERAVEPLVGDRSERLVRALQDALGADVDPRAGGHLAVHRQPEVLEPAELLPVRPVADQVGVRDQHARRPLVGAHDADRLAALHEQRLVVSRVGERAHDRVVRRPVARGLARCRRRPRAPRGARRPPGRGCSSASAAAPRSATTWPSARCRAARGPSRGPLGRLRHAGLPSLPRQRARVRRCVRRRKRARSRGRGAGPGRAPATLRAQQRRAPHRSPARASSGARMSMRAGSGEELDRDARGPARRRTGAACAPPTSPSTRGPPASRCDGIESTLAGSASRFSSETIAAWVYCAIMWPQSTPGSCGEERRQAVVAGLVEEAVGTPLRHRRDVGDDDRQEVEHVGDRRAVEVAVGLDATVLEHHRVVDGGRQLARRHQRRVVDGVAGRAVHLRRAAQRVGVLHPVAVGPAVARHDAGVRRAAACRFAAEAAWPGCGRSACRSAAKTRSVREQRPRRSSPRRCRRPCSSIAQVGDRQHQHAEHPVGAVDERQPLLGLPARPARGRPR